jgi:hypothetical protein
LPAERGDSGADEIDGADPVFQIIGDTDRDRGAAFDNRDD